jgi:hypothetical protein
MEDVGCRERYFEVKIFFSISNKNYAIIRMIFFVKRKFKLCRTKKTSNSGSTFHNNHLIIKILSVLHLIFWIIFAITMGLNNTSLRLMKENHYYYLIGFNKICFLLVLVATIMSCVFWSCIFKNFEFYCEAFQRQLRGTIDYPEGSQEDNNRNYSSPYNQENPSVTINYN